jgi:hypothetical protein
MKSVMMLVLVMMAACVSEDVPMDDQADGVFETTGVEVEEPAPEESDLWNIRDAFRRQCYSGCDSEESSCLGGACAIFGECRPSGGVWGSHAQDCQAEKSQCDRGCSCTFGGGLGGC